jgi:hypothetical protein
MKLLTFPVRLLLRLVLLPLKLLLATAGLTFRTGFKAGTLPVKGGFVAGRALGLKALVLFAAGVALGVFVGRKLGSTGVELADASYGGFGGSDDTDGDRGAMAVATLVEDTIEVVDTPDGPVMALVEDTIEVVETADGEMITETVTVTELDDEEAAAVLEAVEAEIAAEEAEELDDEIEAEIDQALGFTGGELGVDATDDATDEAR